MCGLVGVAGDLSHKEVSAFRDLVRFDTVRGAHSTGIASIGGDKTEAPAMMKATIPGWDFFDMLKDTHSVVNAAKHVIFGHNRHATKGVINKANAHPFFVEDTILGMHNGTLTEHESKKFIDDWSSYGTDSEAALTSLATRGEIETLSNIVGAWAFVWYNYDDNTLNFTRNDQRPLHIAVSKDSKIIFWSSEYYMLLSAMARNGINTSDYSITLLEPLKLCSFEMPDNLRGAFPKPKIYTYKEKKGWSVTRPPHQPPKRLPPPKAANSTTPHGSIGNDRKVVNITQYRQAEALQAILMPPAWIDGKEWSWKTANGDPILSETMAQDYVRNCHCAVCGSKIDAAERWRVFPGKTFVCETCAEDNTEVLDVLTQGGITA